MKVAVCQLPDIRSDVPAALSLVQKHAAEAGNRGAHLVCFPECYLQGYDIRRERLAELAVDVESDEFNRVLKQLATVVPVIVLGFIERQAEAFYNSAVAISQGELIAHYRKTQLLHAERQVFKAGAGPAIFEVDGTKVGIQICSDLNFTESVERSVAAGAKVLACPCNNMLPRAAAEAWKHQHNEIRSRLAAALGVWIASADVFGERDTQISYGPTAIINPSGAVVEQVPLMTSGMVVTSIP